MKKVNREHIMNTTTPDEKSEKEGLARNQGNEPRELSSEELESIIGGSEVGIGIGRSGIEEREGKEREEEVNIFGIYKSRVNIFGIYKSYTGTVGLVPSGDAK